MRKAILLAVLVTACGSTVSPTTAAAPAAEPTTTAPITTAAPITASAETTTSAAVDAAPVELAGIWRGEVTPGDRVTLNLQGNSYTISRGGNTGTGKISVVGDIVTFSGSTLCDGVGAYQWSVSGDELMLVPTGEGDPCSGRVPALDGVAYSR